MSDKKYDIKYLQSIRKQWYSIPLEIIPEEKREIFINRKKAIDLYIDGEKVHKIFQFLF